MPQPQPNILLITTDQQRYDAAGGGVNPAAPSFLRTPHYDHLCREGVTFTRAYADCPLCVPSRVSVMTGKTLFAHGHNTNGPTTGVMGRDDTLPGVLRRHGYQTAAVGKMHFGPERARHGFDEMILPADYYRQMARSGQALQPMRHGLGQNELYPALATVPESLSLTNWIADQCLEYIKYRRDPSAPFFLWCSFSKPHPPLDPPEPYYSMYRDCPIPQPVHGDWSDDEHAPPAFVRFRQSQSYDLIPPEIIRAARAAYYGLITQIDYNLGRVFAGLQDLNQFNDTLMLYTSDHGEYLGDHHAGSKVFFHEPSAHIPFVVRMPKSWDDRRHGSVVESPVTLADVMPTILAGAGAAKPEGCDGLDLLGVARGLSRGRQYVDAAGLGRRDYVAITDGRWKYIHYGEGPCEQLFDLQTDPKELHNLAGLAEYRQQCQVLKAELTSRHLERKSAWIENGQLAAYPAKVESVADRRNTSWPGYHSEQYDVDVRH